MTQSNKYTPTSPDPIWWVRTINQSEIKTKSEDHFHLHHWWRLFHVIMLDWNHLNLTAEQRKSPCFVLCWPWWQLLGKASEVNPLRTMNDHKNHFLSSSEASAQSVSVMCGSGRGQRGDLVCDGNPHHLLLLKLEIKAFPRRTSQFLFTIVSTLGRMEPPIMFRWSGETSGALCSPNSCKRGYVLMIFYSIRVYHEVKWVVFR